MILMEQKGMAVGLTMMAIFVFLSDYKELIKYFLKTPPLFEEQRTVKINKISKLKFIYIPLVFIGFFVLIITLKDKFLSQNQFFGAWEMQKIMKEFILNLLIHFKK